MEVDHFNPTLAGDARHNYLNLMPAIRHCNGKKSDHWPTKAQQKQGIRFIDPTQEQDYGHQIFEDPITYELIGRTPAARYHIRYLDLNAGFLIQRRKHRADLHAKLQSPAVFAADWSKAGAGAQMIAELRRLAELGIPLIPAPPPPSPL